MPASLRGSLHSKTPVSKNELLCRLIVKHRKVKNYSLNEIPVLKIYLWWLSLTDRHILPDAMDSWEGVSRFHLWFWFQWVSIIKSSVIVWYHGCDRVTSMVERIAIVGHKSILYLAYVHCWFSSNLSLRECWRLNLTWSKWRTKALRTCSNNLTLVN